MKRNTIAFALVVLARMALPPAPAEAQSNPREPPPRYGTKSRSLYRIAASEFSPINTFATYEDFFDGQSNFRRKCTSGLGSTFLATAHLPTGAVVDYLELDYCDTDSNLDLLNNPIDVYLNAYDCNYLGGGCTQIKGLQSSNGTAVNTGCGYVSDDTLSLTIDNNTRELMLTVLLYNDAGLTSLAGAIVGYHLQISQPSGQTFADVPSNYLYYRAIEALAASGIASGCGNGNFCPDQAVSRGEMAKFLANALGLHFPN